MLESVIPLRHKCLRGTRTSSRTAAQLFFTQRALAGHKFKNKQSEHTLWCVRFVGNSEQFRYLLRRRRTRKKLLASQSVVSAFTSEQRRRHVTFCGKGGARKRADVFLAKKNGTKRTLLRRGSSSWAATRALALAACLACPIALRFSRALGACAISPVRALLF